MSAVRPGPVPEGVIRRFTRGTERPRGAVWFGARSFWGHMRHFVASAMATQNGAWAREFYRGGTVEKPTAHRRRSRHGM